MVIQVSKVVMLTLLIILITGIVASSGCLNSDDVKQDYQKFQEEYKQFKQIENGETNHQTSPAPQDQGNQGQQPVQQPQPQEEQNNQLNQNTNNVNNDNEIERWSGTLIDKGGRFRFDSPYGSGIILVPKAGRTFVTASEETADFVAVIHKDDYYYLLIGFEGEVMNNNADDFLKSLGIVINNAKIISVKEKLSNDIRGGEDNKGTPVVILIVKFKTRNQLRTGDKLIVKIYSKGVDLVMIDAPIFVDDIKNSIYEVGNIAVGGTYIINKNKIEKIYIFDTIVINDKTTSNILLVRDDEKVGTYYLYMIVKTDDEKPTVVPFPGGGLSSEFEVKKATRIWSNYYIKLTLYGKYETGDWIDIKFSINDLNFRVHSQVTVISSEELKKHANLIDIAFLFIQKILDISYANTSY